MRSAALTLLALLVAIPAVLAGPQWHGNNHFHAYRPADAVVIPPAVSSSVPQVTPIVPPVLADDSNGQASVVNGGGVPQATTPPGGSTQNTSSTSSPSGGVKGVVFNEDNAARAATMSASWACNWDTTPGAGVPPGAEYVPQLWGPAKSLQVQSSPYVLYYNEPDLCDSEGTGGSCVDVQTTINNFPGFKSQASGKKVSSPCVRNSKADYLETFLKSQKPDILCFHWYGYDLAGLTSTVEQFQQLQSTYQVGEIWIPEWGLNYTPTDISQYENYLNGQVNRYAYNLYNLGAGGTI
ncbi:hypothetical protein MMC21_003004 [Puttea exsequens]|nr:hypothetical protein [Puttea exsequens]